MKNVLITGTNSFVGTSLKNWLEKYPAMYSVDEVSLRNDLWKQKSFSNYDVIVHTVGIAHIRESRENANLYYVINRDLAVETAKKAKRDGVNHFVFLSSMSVYGIESGTIDKNTVPNPASCYGLSKLQAEKLILQLKGNEFNIAIIRPPMIYGRGCKGNYTKLANLALKLPAFPDVKNKRSMIHIDNLCEFVRFLIDGRRSGLFFPQNKEYVCTSEMVKLIAEVHRKKIRLVKLFNPILRASNLRVVTKVFGDLIYERASLDTPGDFCLHDFKSSILMTEGGIDN